MNYTEVIRDSRNSASHIRHFPRSAVFATVQVIRSNDGGLAFTMNAIKSSLNSASADTIETKQIANAIDLALRRDEGGSQSGFVVVVHVGPDVIEVSVAGPHRVHFVAPNGTIIASAREHILAYDTEAAAALAPYRRFNDEWIATRSIGAGATALGPETTRWLHHGSGAVVICSTDLHRDQPPGAYLPTLLAPIENWGALEGSAAVIRREVSGPSGPSSEFKEEKTH